VSSVWLTLGFLLLTGRGLRAIATSLVRDLAADLPDPVRESGGGVPIVDRSRVPLHRVLAFRGVTREGAARRRWEGGFGRRGL
jgi:hypothetical protein